MSAAQPTSSPDVDAIASRYEELRDHAMAGTAGPLRGLVLLVREGVVAWMRAWDQCVRPVPAPSPAVRPVGDHTELVRLLADAALGQLEMAAR
jgi:hypothetical protein